MSDIEALFGAYLDEIETNEYVREAQDQAEIPTLPTGPYVLNAKSAVWNQASDGSPWPGRLVLTVQAGASNGDGSVGSVRFDMSPIVMRTKTNRLDGPSALYNQVLGAFDLVGSTRREVADAVMSFALQAYVEEIFNTDEGWKTAKTPEQSKDFRSKGFPRRNAVRSLKRVRG